MDEIRRPQKIARPQRPVFRPRPAAPSPAPTSVASNLNTGRTIKLVVPKFWRRGPALPLPVQRFLRNSYVRFMVVLILAILVIAEIIPIVQPGLKVKAYTIGNASVLLPEKNARMASLLTYDAKQAAYNFNANYTPITDDASAGGNAQGGASITAIAYADASKGVKVTDPYNKVDFTIKPKFSVGAPKQEANRLIYPLNDGSGWLIYTMQANQVKEDVLLRHAPANSIVYNYDLELNDALQARLDTDGSVGIYGSDLPINGTVSTGSEKDARLLAAARQNTVKNKLLFSLPTPYVKETNRANSVVKVRYQVRGSHLAVKVDGLNRASYPLTIDPSVYVKSAAKLMRGNNESNISFDSTNNQILKGSLTGARIPDWSTNPTPLPVALWQASTVVTGGFIYVVGGNNGTNNLDTVYYAAINTGTHTIGTWSTKTAYNLPSPRSGLNVVAYNGYLIAMGGQNASCGGSFNICGNVYSTKLSANGEPISWSATTSMPLNRSYGAAAAYENRVYYVGGRSATNAVVATTYYADLNPDGTVTNWTASTAIPTAMFGATANMYNGYLLVTGGNQGGNTLGTIYYAKITAAGIGTWTASVNILGFSNTSGSTGGSTTVVVGGYMYTSGGCSAVNASDYCTTTQDNLLTASLNADGTTSVFTKLVVSGTTSTLITLSRLGAGVVAWDGAIYSVGGCSAQNTSTGACTTLLSSVSYGVISKDGDVGPSVAATTLPAVATPAGQMSSGVAIDNGYIYSIGGCTNVACSTITNKVFYSPIASNGSIGAWTATTALLPAARGAMGVAVYNDTLYITGGAATGNAGGTTTGYYASLGATGDIATWNTAGTAPLASATTYPFTFARTNPANVTQAYLYIVGGCTTGSGIGCSAGSYKSEVRRCLIASVGAAPTACATSGLQLGTGVGVGAGAVFGNYVYLAGGADNSGAGQTSTVYYAKIDNAGLVVLPPNKAGTAWPTTTASLSQIRRRATAYAVNGYLYVLAGHDGSGTPVTLNDLQIGKINVETGDVTGPVTNNTFMQKTNVITARWDFRGGAANGYMYAIGGCSAGDPPSACTAFDGASQYLQVYNNASGSPALFNSGSQYTTDRIGGSAVINNGFIYFAGGCTVVTCAGSTTTNQIDVAPLNADGTVGTWTTATAMGTARNFFKLLAYKNYMYAIGGTTNGTAIGTTERATINPTTGVLGTWTADTALPATRTSFDGVIYNGYMYITGGLGPASTYTNTVYQSTINAGTGALVAWSTTTAFTTARSGHLALSYNSTLYIIGGFDGTNYFGDVQYAKISSADGTVGAWTFTVGLPQPVQQGSGFAANGYLYVSGGRSAAATCTGNTYVASINANSTVANGNNPTGLGSWSQTNVKFNGARYGAASAFDSGKIYVIGGGCAALITGVDRVYYSTLLSQPQIAKFSYIIDAGSNVTPLKTLFNGIDYGIGAGWQLNYRSSTTAAAAWGLATNYGNIALGTPQIYTPLDAGGTNTNISQYHWIELTIDVSQAFGYPEDLTRGPTITDLTFLFTSDPSKRLRNGKTFIGGEQQPLDTPF